MNPFPLCLRIVLFLLALPITIVSGILILFTPFYIGFAFDDPHVKGSEVLIATCIYLTIVGVLLRVGILLVHMAYYGKMPLYCQWDTTISIGKNLFRISCCCCSCCCRSSEQQQLQVEQYNIVNHEDQHELSLLDQSNL